MTLTGYIFEVNLLWEKMQSGERGTSETYVNIAELPFPVFTICPVYPYKDERLAFHGVPGVGEIQVTYKHFQTLTLVATCHIK